MPRKRESMKPWTDLDRTSIDHFRQNKPSYVVNDILKYFSENFGLVLGRDTHDAVWSILLARGVLKWMSSRRALITIKLMLRARIRDHQQQIQQKKKVLSKIDNMNRRSMARYGQATAYHLGRLRGSLASTELIYKQIRKICHSMRWQVPDNDLRSTPFWISEHSRTGKELLTDVYSKPEKLNFPDWTKMEVGDEVEFSCSSCQAVGKHKLAGIKRGHNEENTLVWPIWICPGDVEETELACFTCGNVEMYGPGDERLCLCGNIPVGWDHVSDPGVIGTRRCSSCHCFENVVRQAAGYICARCSYRDPEGSWFGSWIKMFNGNE